MPADAVDEYIRIGESTATKSLLRFCAAVIAVFGDEYLREPTTENIVRLAAMNEERGFIGMLGSLDCMHWAWKNCPTAWAGQYAGKEEEPTIVLEAVVSRDLWFWHAFFGMPSSHNDINVLERSDLFPSFANSDAPRCTYTINGNDYDIGYFMADSIYPAWATLVQTIPVPRDNKEKHFAKKQEGARKDVERVFGVLQAKFATVKGPGRFWSHTDLSDIITTCIILHNMIVEDERGENLPWDYDGASNVSVLNVSVLNVSVSRNGSDDSDDPDDSDDDFDSFLARLKAIRSKQVHIQLQKALVEHLWQLNGDCVD